MARKPKTNGSGAYDAPKDYEKAAMKKGARSNGADNDDDFDQGGADGARKQRAGKHGEKGHNSIKFEGAVLREMIDTIAAAEERNAKRMKEASKACQKDRDIIASAKKDLVESGYPSTELGKLVQRARYLRKADNIAETLGDEQKETFEKMLEALGGLADTPLGRAAVDRSGLHPGH